MNLSRTLSLSLCVLYALSAGCISSKVDVVSPEEALSNIFPSPVSIPGWLPKGPLTFYDEDNLFEYINGEAETYFAYDFRLLATREYIYAADASQRLVVDVYDMELPTNAFGVYSTGRTPEEDFVKLGREGYIVEDTVLFYKNRYFVKISPFRGFPEAKEAGLKFAKALSQRIPKAKEGIRLLRYLPPRGLVARSETYYLRDVLGYRFLKNGFTAEYIVEGERLSIFLCEYPDLKEARDAFVAFKKEVKKSEALTRTVSGLGEESIAGEVKFLGPIVIFQKGRFLAGAKLRKFSHSPRALLEALSSKLP